MIFRRPTELIEGHARYVRQSGPPGRFGAFDYVAMPNAAVESVLVGVRKGPRIESEYVPGIVEGVEQGQAALAECGEWVCSVEIEISSMRVHPIDSSHFAFAQAGKQFVQGALRDACVPLVALDPTWRTPDVLALARHVHQTHDHSDLPVLADALQDAGCDFALLLDHCRAACDHGASCWVVQLTLADPG